MKICRITLAALLLCLTTGPLHAAIAVIKNPANPAVLDERQVRSAYLGKLRVFPDGDAIKPYDLPSNSMQWNSFIDKVLRKTPATLNSYWARILFSSKGKPPKVLETQDEILQAVANNKDAIGYIDSSKVNDSVAVMFLID